MKPDSGPLSAPQKHRLLPAVTRNTHKVRTQPSGAIPASAAELANPDDARARGLRERLQHAQSFYAYLSEKGCPKFATSAFTESQAN